MKYILRLANVPSQAAFASDIDAAPGLGIPICPVIKVHAYPSVLSTAISQDSLSKFAFEQSVSGSPLESTHCWVIAVKIAL